MHCIIYYTHPLLTNKRPLKRANSPYLVPSATNQSRPLSSGRPTFALRQPSRKHVRGYCHCNFSSQTYDFIPNTVYSLPHKIVEKLTACLVTFNSVKYRYGCMPLLRIYSVVSRWRLRKTFLYKMLLLLVATWDSV